MRATAREPHLRLCQCREHGCAWHRRHRGCGGPLVLLLAQVRGGWGWRLADVCRACAAATDHAAVVGRTDPTAGRQPAPACSDDLPDLGLDLAGGDGIADAVEQDWTWWEAQD